MLAYNIIIITPPSCTSKPSLVSVRVRWPILYADIAEDWKNAGKTRNSRRSYCFDRNLKLLITALFRSLLPTDAFSFFDCTIRFNHAAMVLYIFFFQYLFSTNVARPRIRTRSVSGILLLFYTCAHRNTKFIVRRILYNDSHYDSVRTRSIIYVIIIIFFSKRVRYTFATAYVLIKTSINVQINLDGKAHRTILWKNICRGEKEMFTTLSITSL